MPDLRELDVLAAADADEERPNPMPDEKFDASIKALENLDGEVLDVLNRDERLGVLKGLQHAARWAETGEALDDLVAAGWDVELRHHPQGWACSLVLATEETTALVASGWHGKAAGAVFEAADLAAEALRPVPEVNDHDHFGFEGEEGR